MYAHVFVGGTFDTLHKGHAAVLTRAFGEGEHVTIGITSDAYISKYKHDPHKSYSDRKQSVLAWLTEHKYENRATIIPIDNPYEPAASGKFTALIVTPQNYLRGEEINVMREQNGLTPLALLNVATVNAQDGEPISSTKIRSGIVDLDGKLVMPDQLREILATPLGDLLDKSDVPAAVNQVRHNTIITVGDITTTKLLNLGVVPTLSIIDLKAQRKPFQPLEDFHFPEQSEIVHVKSGPGFLSADAVDAVHEWANTAVPNRNTVIIVDGEEDLMTIPAIISAPLGSVVFYGQPDMPFFLNIKSSSIPIREGMVIVHVTQETKQHAMELLAKFNKN